MGVFVCDSCPCLSHFFASINHFYSETFSRGNHASLFVVLAHLCNYQTFKTIFSVLSSYARRTKNVTYSTPNQQETLVLSHKTKAVFFMTIFIICGACSKEFMTSFMEMRTYMCVCDMMMTMIIIIMYKFLDFCSLNFIYNFICETQSHKVDLRLHLPLCCLI